MERIFVIVSVVRKMSKKRLGKVTHSQQNRLLEFVEEYPPMLTKKFDKNFTLAKYDKLWNDITKILNAENNNLNARTSEKWQRVKFL